MNRFFRDKKWLKEKDENLTGDDCQEGLYLVFNITAPGISYDAQTKSRIVQLEMAPFTNTIISELRNWLETNEKAVKILADKAINARKAREAARKAREAARNAGEGQKKKLLNLPTKLVDAWGKKRQDCELLVAEGDSAASGLIGARDGETQAVFPIRGKILNLYKASAEKIFANQEVINIIKALGLDLDVKTGKIHYDKNKLRYGKILLCADADPDGQAIKNLLLTCFWSLCPELVINGHIYATIPPLFRVTTRKNEYIYLRDAAALEEYKLAHTGEKFQINRNKGLGEQDPEELEECLLNPATRNIAQITVNDVNEAAKLFEIFMGPTVAPRKDWILQHSEEANI
jgi:DNA gyrase subunit B